LLEDQIFLYKAIKIGFVGKVRIGVVKILLRERFVKFLFWSSLVLNLAKVTINEELKCKYFSVEKLRKFFRLEEV